MPGQTSPARLEGLITGRARPADQESPKPEFLWIFFLCFICLPLLVAALAGVTMGTTISAVVHMASVKSLIANLLMRLSR